MQFRGWTNQCAQAGVTRSVMCVIKEQVESMKCCMFACVWVLRTMLYVRVRPAFFTTFLSNSSSALNGSFTDTEPNLLQPTWCMWKHEHFCYSVFTSNHNQRYPFVNRTVHSVVYSPNVCCHSIPHRLERQTIQHLWAQIPRYRALMFWLIWPKVGDGEFFSTNYSINALFVKLKFCLNK